MRALRAAMSASLAVATLGALTTPAHADTVPVSTAAFGTATAFSLLNPDASPQAPTTGHAAQAHTAPCPWCWSTEP
ncbi:hypothetical protein [Sinosporangium siamense]|uniref:Uncharacterized protein n=1 Tax=Sinosporangium siamense TaxID=1367973 RepID=A0A919RKH0_9ACTN|nr:hypothetical protein [Sinosporangium siamense]GII95443.1 hypothetical protein Ssi02_56740 [Sinosporangium siamense]